MLPSSIELRLLEMQRKLSAIAEIPKILSSTLATVSQSFGSLSCEEELYRRKCSYDEDALDYELNEEAETEEEEEQEEMGELEQRQLQQHFKSKPVKEATPESDYASEANYAANGLRDEHDNDSGAEEEEEELEEDDETEEGEEQKTVYYLRLPAACVAADSDEEEQQQQQEEDEELPQSDADAADDDSDFLSTSYTWNPRNVPKLRINDAASACNLTQQLEAHNAIDISKVRAATPTPTPTPTPTAVAAEAQVSSVPVISANPNSASSTASQKVKAINELPH